MALLRILNQLQQVNQRLGKFSRLEEAVSPSDYSLPESEHVKHAYSQLFTVQRVHDDVAWAIDCRIRYGLHLVESIPRPEHRLDETFVVSFRINEPKEPGFLVQTWRKEHGAWKLLSFDIKRKSLSPPADLLTRAARPEGAKLADPKLQAAVEMFLTSWLIERRLDAASAVFLPESYACNILAETSTASEPANGNVNVRRFLEVTAAESSKEKTLERTLSAAHASHPELKPLSHTHDGSYLLAEVAPELMQMYACKAGPPTRTPSATVAQAGGVLTAFHLSRSKQASTAAISLYWKNVNGNWRIASFTVSAD